MISMSCGQIDNSAIVKVLHWAGSRATATTAMNKVDEIERNCVETSTNLFSTHRMYFAWNHSISVKLMVSL